MLKELIKMAGQLDALGLRREADFTDKIIRKVALTEEDFNGGTTINIRFIFNTNIDQFNTDQPNKIIKQEKIDKLSSSAKRLFISKPYAEEHKKKTFNKDPNALFSASGIDALTDKDIPSNELLTFHSPVDFYSPESASVRLVDTNFGEEGQTELSATFLMPTLLNKESWSDYRQSVNKHKLHYLTLWFIIDAKQCLQESGLDGELMRKNIRFVVESGNKILSELSI